MSVFKACKIKELKIYNPRVQTIISSDNMSLMAVNLSNRLELKLLIKIIRYNFLSRDPTVPIPRRWCGDGESVMPRDRMMMDVRSDGRDISAHRNLCIKTGIVTQAKGSAYLECGSTKLICSVFDPKEVPNKVEYAKTGVLQCEFKFATFSCRQRRTSTRDPEERQLCNELRRALEPAICRGEFANFEILINVLVLENDGSVLAAAITAAGLALMDGCIPMYDVIVATSLGIYKNTILVDPTYDEEKLCSSRTDDEENRGTVMLAYMKNLQQITEFAQNGSMDVNMFPEYVQILTNQNCKLYKMVISAARKDVIEHFENETKE